MKDQRSPSAPDGPPYPGTPADGPGNQGPVNPFVAYRWIGSLIVLGLGITLMIAAL